MNKEEIIKKLYNKEITKNDVIVQWENGDKEKEYPMYIMNDGFDFWNVNGVVSLRFIFKDDDYTYEIISTTEYKKRIEEKERQEKIKKLEEELYWLRGGK